LVSQSEILQLCLDALQSNLPSHELVSASDHIDILGQIICTTLVRSNSAEAELGYQKVLQFLGNGLNEFQVNQGGNIVDNPLTINDKIIDVSDD
jgi:hypothetical protein